MSTLKPCEIVVVNNSSVTWYRHYHDVSHGQWIDHPVEAIEPGKTMTCSCERSSQVKSLSGKVQYCMVLSSVEYIISLQFRTTSLFGSPKFTSVMDRNRKDDSLPIPSSLFSIREKVEDQPSIKYGVEIFDTDKGHDFLESRREALVAAFAANAEMFNAKAVLPFSCTQILSLHGIIPKDFIWNVRNVDWMTRLRKAHISLRIRIVNLTLYTMKLSVKRGRKPLLPLEDGVWVEFPNEVIPPHCCTEFGVQSEALFVGTAGCVNYELSGQDMTITFAWNQRGVWSFRSWNEQTVERFAISIHTERLNEGSVIFHVLDPNVLPKIQVTRAVAHFHLISLAYGVCLFPDY
eukprot:GHVN01059388.1.p1 GENE.GHVN01059388.1~~GHVN01059388.1.p1  ORF type:complete len:348 (+),score=19.30 GHVN01059388.1:61-1104(+)